MMTQTPLSAASRATLASPEKCASNSSSESQASSLQNLIANLELEFCPTHRKLSPLRISNRKYFAIFHPNSQARSRATSPNFQNGNPFCSTPLIYPELRRAHLYPPKLSSLQPQVSSLQILIANARSEFHSTRRKLSSLKIPNRERIAISQFAPQPLRRPASPSLRSEPSVNPTPIVYPELRKALSHPHKPSATSLRNDLGRGPAPLAQLHPRNSFESFIQFLRSTDHGSRATEFHVPQDTQLFLYLDLIRIAGHDLRDFQVARDFAGHAQVFIAIQVFGPAEFRAVTPPDDQRKHLIRILFVKVDKCRLAFAARDEMDAHHSPAHGRLFSHVIFRFSRGDALRLRRRGGRQQQECGKNRDYELSQGFAFRIRLSAISRQHGRSDFAHCKCLNRQSKRQTLGWCGKRSSKGFRRVRPGSAILIYGTAIRNPRKALKT
jgi:hypothetical protein